LGQRRKVVKRGGIVSEKVNKKRSASKGSGPIERVDKKGKKGNQRKVIEQKKQ